MSKDVGPAAIYNTPAASTSAALLQRGFHAVCPTCAQSVRRVALGQKDAG